MAAKTTEKHTPLTFACLLHGDGTDPKMNRIKIIQSLLNHGADPLMRNGAGEYAVNLCMDPSLKMLLAAYTYLALSRSNTKDEDLRKRCEQILNNSTIPSE